MIDWMSTIQFAISELLNAQVAPTKSFKIPSTEITNKGTLDTNSAPSTMH